MHQAGRTDRYNGIVVGNGHCVAFVRQAAQAPHTSQWRRGPNVRTHPPPEGTAIATFDADGSYGNHTDGRSHAAILLAVGIDGLEVRDQWVGRAVATRIIRYKGGRGDPVNDGDAYYTILSGEAETA
jgi:hypothetical protein